MFSITIEVTEQELKDLLNTAVDGGGSNYWAEFQNYDPNLGTVEMRTAQEQGPWAPIAVNDVVRGMELAVTLAPAKVAAWLQDRVGDAAEADAFLQLAYFGEIRYP